jgi:hypothetical protein
MVGKMSITTFSGNNGTSSHGDASGMGKEKRPVHVMRVAQKIGLVIGSNIW